mgnify:CR=1 FL=1
MPRSIHYSFFKASQPIPFFFIVWLMCVLYITAYTTPSNDNAMLEIERAKLKAEQERLEVEKQRAWIERQEQLNRIGTQSIDQGWCLMNGGGWGC